VSEAAIELHDVSFGYGTEAVIRGASFAVAEREFVGIIGPNGSGKSTLLRLMSGYLRPWSGAVRVGGRPVESYARRELAQLIGVVPQDTAMTFPFSVTEMVLFGRTPHGGGFGFERGRDLAAARQAMERTDTTALARRAVTELSGGERQRVILARALAQEPAILLLDEPAAFLDIRHEVEMYDLLRDLQQEGMTVVSVLHDLNIAALYCDRLLLLNEGCVAKMGSPAEVITYDALTSVYGTEVYVALNDVTGCLNVLPLSRKHRQQLREQFGDRTDGST
jgi:iron complex transport system ATP-binding protein